MAETAENEDAETKKKANQDEQAIADYFAGLAGSAPFQIKVSRQRPKVYKGVNVEGVLNTYEEFVTEEDIKEAFGGGTYLVTLSVANAQGSYQYKKSRTIKIPGPPNIDDLVEEPTNGGQDTMAQEMLRMADRRAEKAEHRAQKLEDALRESQDDSGIVHLLMSQLDSLRQSMADKDERITELLTRRPETSSAEILLGKAIDGESARIQNLMAQHASELRQRADQHQSEIERLHDRYKDDANRREDAHRREVDNLKQAYENQITTLKLSYDGRIEGYKREVTRLERELDTVRAESVELRAKKEKGLVESLTEMATLKAALEEFGGGPKDETSTLERIVQGIMGSPLAEGIATRIASAPQALGVPVSNPEPELPVNTPTRLPNGKIVVRRPDNRIVEIRPRERPPQPTGQALSLTPEALDKVIPFMENALRNERPAADFVSAARSLAPDAVGPIIELLRAQGADGFLDAVARHAPGSPLVQQHGKNWTRKVAAVLLE